MCRVALVAGMKSAAAVALVPVLGSIIPMLAIAYTLAVVRSYGRRELGHVAMLSVALLPEGLAMSVAVAALRGIQRLANRLALATISMALILAVATESAGRWH